MPIGKNSIKRVANGGYSNVKSAAPDMENSTVLANPAPEVIEKMIPSAKKCAPKKSAGKPAAKKSTVKPTVEEESFDTVEYVAIGGQLPIYLL